MGINYKSFFRNKKCSICGNQASIFRLIKEKRFLLCDKKECDIKSKIQSGWIDLINIGVNK